MDFLKEPVDSKQYSVIKEKIVKRFERTLQADPNLIEVSILGLDGRVLASSDREEEGADESQDDYFTQGLKGTFIKDVYFTDDGLLTYVVSTPIKDSSGKLMGVSLLRYNPNFFYSIVKNENGLGDTEENFLINKDKYLITPSRFLDKNYILKQQINTENAEKCYDSSEMEYVSKNGYSGLISKFGSQLVEALDYRKVDVIATHAYIPETGWCLITKVDKAQALSFRNILTIVNIFILLGSIIIFFIIGYFLSKKITKPLKDLELGTEEIKKGNFEYKINVVSNDEIGVLAGSFNSMVSKIKESKTEIETKVEAQTRDIRSKAKELDEQKQAILNILEDVEKEKNKSEEISRRLNLATKSAKIGVWEWDVVNNILTWDDQMYILYGIKKSDFGGAYDAWQNGLHPDDRAAGDLAIKKALSGEKEFSPVFRVVWPSGDIRYIQAYAIVERDDSGKPLKMIGVNFDITHEKEVDKAKTEFVSLASHQLRTPLSSINWYTEMLLNGDAGEINDNQKKYLNEVYIGSQRMVELVNSLLNVSRLDLGTFVINPILIDVPKMVKSLLEELKPQIKEKKQLINEDYADNLPLFSADESLLRMVLQNLLSNAVKYTPVGGQVTADIRIIDDKFRIKISDTGMGIPKAQQDKIFMKLFRADNAKQSETEGTGLGLYIIKSIVDQAGGEVWFESEENRGTTFYVSFPVSGMIKKEGLKSLNT